MKITTHSSGFVFDLAGGSRVGVTFYFEQGKPSKVKLVSTDGAIASEIPNTDGRWKPCVTHSKRLIEQAVKANPSATKRAQPKVDAPKAGLKIYRG